MAQPLQPSPRTAFYFAVLVSLLVTSRGVSAQGLTVTAVGGESQEAITGEVAVLQFNVTPSVAPEDIDLTLNDVDITTGSPIQFLSVSADRQSVTLNPAIPLHEGIYRLLARNGTEETSALISLEILSPPGLMAVPEDVIEHEGETAMFECFATGNPTPTVEWIFQGQVIDAGTGKYHIGEFGTENFGSLTIYNLTYSDHGVYTCNASNLIRSLTISAELSVQQFPVIEKDPVNTTTAAGGVGRLNCSASGFPLPDIVWMKEGVAISQLNDNRFSAEMTPFMDELLSVSVLTLNSPVLSDNGLYSCNATNQLKTFDVITSAAADLFIHYPPLVTVNNETVTINQTDSVLLYCEAFGIPSPHLHWESSRNPSQTLENTTSLNILSFSFENGSDFMITASTLQINGATRNDHEANFTCVGGNGVENFISSPEFATTELIVQVPPTLVFPAPHPVLGLVKENVTLIFVIEDASPAVRAMNIEWEFRASSGSDSVVLVESDRYHFMMNDQSLTISNIAHSDEGDYTIRATNEAGSDSFTITLHVEAAPEFVTFSNDTNVLEGNDATLVCSATSEPTHTVQWLKNGVPLNLTVKYSIDNNQEVDEREVVSTLVVFNVSMSDTADYTCQVNNTHGSQSATAHVEVQIIPRILQSPDNTIGLFANKSALFCSAFGSPIPSIDWLKDGHELTLPGPYVAATNDLEEAEFISTSYLRFSNLSFDNAGEYICRASNNLDSLQRTNSSVANLTVNHPPVINNFLTSLVFNETQNVNLSCNVFGLPTPNVTWSRFDLAAIPLVSSKFVTYVSSSPVLTGGMETQSILQINAVNGDDTGNYTCTGVNQPLGPEKPTDMDNALLYLLVQTSPRVSLISNQFEIGVKGMSITLRVTVFGDEPTVLPNDIHWYLNSNEITKENNERVEFSDDRFSLSISNLSLSDEGNYNIFATNIIGNDTKMILLNVQVSPVILETSGNVTQVQGRSAIFHCTAFSEPLHITSWTFTGNSEPLVNSNKYQIQGQDTSNSTLTVFNVSLADEGSYTCNTSNVHGIDIASATLRVQVPPKIIVQPPSKSVQVTMTANLTCCASGIPLPEIRWIKNKDLLLNDSLSVETSFSESSICSSLLLTSLVLSDTANYSCNASNLLEEVLIETSTAAFLTVLYPPEVFPLSMHEYVKNESDSFTTECIAFGVPLPQIYWIPAPLISVETDQNLLYNSDIGNLLERAVSSRFDNTSSLCPTMPPLEETSGSGTDKGSTASSSGGDGMNSNSTSCAPSSALNVTNCSLPEALCSVPCGINIESSESVDKYGRAASTSRLTICSLEKADELSYTCLAINGISNVINTSEATTSNLIVQVPPEVSPANNQSQLAFEDRSTTLEFVIERASPDVMASDIDWVLESDRLSKIISISEDNDARYSFNQSRRALTIVNLTILDSGKYRLTATNPAGINSDFIDLDIQAFPDLKKTTSPTKVETGVSVDLSCFAEGSPLQDVKWEFTDVFGNLQYTLEYIITDPTPGCENGTQKVTLHQSSSVSISSVEDQFMISGTNCTNATKLYGTLTIKNITAFQAGMYNCTLTNIHNTASYSTSVDVQLFPRILEGPGETECTAGGPCKLTCLTEGVPSPSLTWFQNGSPVSEDDSVEMIPSFLYSTSNSTLLFDKISLGKAGSYHCQASNFLVLHMNATSAAAFLTVTYPAEVAVEMENVIGNESESASLVCIVAGIPRPLVSWSRVNTSSGLQVDIVSDLVKYTIVETNMSGDQGLQLVRSELTVLNLDKTQDELSYHCDGANNVTNLLGVLSTSQAFLTVQVPPKVSTTMPNPIFTKGNDIQISFLIEGAFPPVELSGIRWTHNDMELNTSCLDCELRYNFTEGLLTLNITNLQVSDDGNFTLMARNPAGIDKATVDLTVHVLPLFNTTGRTIRINSLDSIELTCTADGIPRPTIGWYRNSILIIDDLQQFVTVDFEIHEAFREDITGQRGITSTLTNNRTAVTEAGMYVCQANNDAGDGVLPVPYTIEVTQVVVDYCAGNPCQNGGDCLNGEEGFTCQCVQKDGVTYGGDTCDQVVVIPVKPVFTTVPTRQVVNLFAPATLHCEAEGEPKPLISWFKDNVILNMEHGNTLVFDEVLLENRGNYTCKAENTEGRIESPPVLVNVRDVVQYSSELIVPPSQLAGDTQNETQLKTASQELVDGINQFASGQEVVGNVNTTFYFIEISGTPVDNGDNITIPIILTVIASDRVDEELRQSVATSLQMLNLGLGDFEGIQRYNYCPPEVTELPSPDGNPDLQLIINWPETLIGEVQEQACPCGFSLNFSSLIARRKCGGDFGVTGAQWLPANVTPCEFSVLARRICRLSELNDTTERVSELRNITKEELGATEVTVTVAAIDSTVGDARGNLSTTTISLDVIDNVALTNRTALMQSQRDGGTSSMLQNVLFNLTQSLNVEEPIPLLKQTFAIRIENRQPNSLGNLSSSNLNSTYPMASASFPANLLPGSVGTGNIPTLFSAFVDDALFLPRDPGQTFVSTSVIDITLSGVGEVSNLENMVNFSFARSNVLIENATQVQCSFWDPTLDDGFGNWSTSGCNLVGEMNTSATSFMCQCNHLTSFAVLLDVSPQPPPPSPPVPVFEIFTYIGLTVSIISLGIVIFTYLYSPKLRRSDANKILLNLCFSLLGLYVTFLLAAQGTAITEPLCAIVGALLQYFFLVNFFVMAAESVDLFIKLVIVLGPKIQHFVLKVMLLSWITPLFFVVFCFAPNYEHYISDTYCGAKGIPFYVGILTPFIVIYIFNWTVFLAIMFSLIKKARKKLGKAKAKQRAGEVKQQLRIAMTVSILFGLGWGFGLGASNSVSVAAIRYIFNIIFTILVAFQGFFIFLLYVVFSPVARNEWRRWILRKEAKKRGYTETSTSGHHRYSNPSKRTTGVTSLHSGGTLHKQVLSSSAFKPTAGSSIAEYSVYESSVMTTHEAALQELRKKFDVEKDDDMLQTYLNPLDLGELISLKEGSDDEDARSLVVETTFMLPMPSPAQALEQDENEEEEDEVVDSVSEAIKDTSDRRVSTFTNPFMRKSMRHPNRGEINPMEDADLLSPSPMSDEETGSGPASQANTNVTVDLSQITASQGFTQSSFGEETVLIRENREISKL